MAKKMMKGSHEDALKGSMESVRRAHAYHGKGGHSDPIIGGESEAEGRVMGQGEFANMPQQVHMKLYPKAHEFGPGVLDDTMGHVDDVNGRAEAKSHKYLSNQH